MSYQDTEHPRRKYAMQHGEHLTWDEVAIIYPDAVVAAENLAPGDPESRSLTDYHRNSYYTFVVYEDQLYLDFRYMHYPSGYIYIWDGKAWK